MRHLHRVALLLGILTVQGTLAQSPETKWKWVAMGLGCLEVPSTYRVVWNEGRIDYFGGYIEPPEKNWQMTWHAGLWASLLERTEQRRVKWKREERIDSQRVVIGRFEEDDGAFLVVSIDLLEFALPAEISNAEALLKAMLRRHSFDCRGLPLEPTEKE